MDQPIRLIPRRLPRDPTTANETRADSPGSAIRATIAAEFSIFAVVDVPIVIFSIKWWRTQHPQPVFWGGGSFPPDWKAVFGWQMLAVMLVGVVFTMVRLRQEQFQREIDSLRRMAHAL